MILVDAGPLIAAGDRDARNRPVKIRVKVAGGLRTITGATAFARLRSYLSTAAKQDRSAFQVLRDLHDGNPWMPVTVPETC